MIDEGGGMEHNEERGREEGNKGRATKRPLRESATAT